MIKVLDHGFVRLVESWGGGDYADSPIHPDENEKEAGIIEAARQSTQGAFRGWDTDEKLLAYLHNNKHATPFEFSGMVIEVKAPLFVFREWHRHRTQSYNEMSARYAPIPNENYVPTAKRIMLKANANKQAGAVADADKLTLSQAEAFRQRLIVGYDAFERNYQEALSRGIPKELARCGMPVGRYSQMRASTCLRNWLSFLSLRMSLHAQWEIQQYANAVGEIVAEEFPRTWALFTETKK